MSTSNADLIKTLKDTLAEREAQEATLRLSIQTAEQRYEQAVTYHDTVLPILAAMYGEDSDEYKAAKKQADDMLAQQTALIDVIWESADKQIAQFDAIEAALRSAIISLGSTL